MPDRRGSRHGRRPDTLPDSSQTREGAAGIHCKPRQAWHHSRREPDRVDNNADAAGVLRRERESDPSRVLIRLAPYDVYEMRFTLEKAKWLWDEMNKYRTLWNDFTRGDFDSWYALIVAKDSYWLEVWKDDLIVGVVYWTDIAQISDVQVHAMFFDRDLAGKTEICQRIAWWFFLTFPECHRMTATVPAIFHSTVRLIKRMGFKEEGRKRESLLMYGNRVDQMIFGLLASEVL